MAGDFTKGTNTVISGTTRKYANHASSSNTGDKLKWNWLWKAPASDLGSITFYVATAKTNNNGSSGGDQIYLSQHVITAQGTNSVKEITSPLTGMKVAYDAINRALVLNFASLNSGEMTLNFLDMSGRSVFYSEIGLAMPGENTHKVKLPADLKSGLYIVHLLVNNNALSAKLQISN